MRRRCCVGSGLCLSSCGWGLGVRCTLRRWRAACRRWRVCVSRAGVVGCGWVVLVCVRMVRISFSAVAASLICVVSVVGVALWASRHAAAWPMLRTHSSWLMSAGLLVVHASCCACCPRASTARATWARWRSRASRKSAGVAGSARAALGAIQWVRPSPMSGVVAVRWRRSCSALRPSRSRRALSQRISTNSLGWLAVVSLRWVRW